VRQKAQTAAVVAAAQAAQARLGMIWLRQVARYTGQSSLQRSPGGTAPQTARARTCPRRRGQWFL